MCIRDRENDLGVALVSGFSPNIAKMVMSGQTDPYDCLLEAINANRYQQGDEARVESMEIKGTKADPNRPMLAVSFKILSGEYKNQRLFMNRVLYGTKNDKNMIMSAIGFLDKLDSGIPVNFTSYKQFAQLVLDIAEAIDGKLEYAVDYDDSRFNSISIDEVFEVED